MFCGVITQKESFARQEPSSSRSVSALLMICSEILPKLKEYFLFFREPHQRGHIPVPTLLSYLIWESSFKLSEVIETTALTWEVH